MIAQPVSSKTVYGAVQERILRFLSRSRERVAKPLVTAPQRNCAVTPGRKRQMASVRPILALRERMKNLRDRSPPALKRSTKRSEKKKLGMKPLAK
jgi:hypothetical protein